jgi:hypothetical protein
VKPQPFLSRFTTLQLTLGISVALHAALLSVRFIDPEGFNRVFQDTPLEVILVNAKSSERPDKAQAIAQQRQQAAKGRAAAPALGLRRWETISKSPASARFSARAANQLLAVRSRHQARSAQPASGSQVPKKKTPPAREAAGRD